MKKLFSVLMALCLLCAAAAALAEANPTMDDMPAAVIEDDNTTVELSAFNGTWVANATFVGDTFVDSETLASSYGITIPTVKIEDGVFSYDEAGEDGSVVTKSCACTFEAGQLQGKDDSGLDFCFDTLVNGDIVMSIFVPGEGEEVVCISIFMVPAEA